MPELTPPANQKRLRLPSVPPPMPKAQSTKRQSRRLVDIDLCPTGPPDKYTIPI